MAVNSRPLNHAGRRRVTNSHIGWGVRYANVSVGSGDLIGMEFGARGRPPGKIVISLASDSGSVGRSISSRIIKGQDLARRMAPELDGIAHRART